MSQPMSPPGEPVDTAPAAPATPPPAVPYGPRPGESDTVPTAVASIDLSRSGVAGTAGKWALRLLLPIIVRAIFRAIFR
jgi:hypothetical protein